MKTEAILKIREERIRNGFLLLEWGKGMQVKNISPIKLAKSFN